MKTFCISHDPFSFHRMIALFGASCLALLAISSVADAQIDGFTEPFRKIELASDESGSIAELFVEEGDRVRENDPIAQLDSRIQELQLEIAEQLAGSQSQLVAAEEAYKKRQAISKKLRQLRDDGNASESEIIRSDMELSIAKAKHLSTQEDAAVREIEKRRAEVQLGRRVVLAPFSGRVAKIHRHEGEFLSPLRPEVVTLVQVDRLIAKFSVPSSQITAFQIGQEFNIQLEGGRTVLGTVQNIGVETDAQSGTVEVKLVIENPKFEFRSGEICTLNI